MKWTQNEPCYGDMVRVKITFYYHYGIYADENTVIQFGLPNNVQQPADEVKVLSTDIYTFLSGGELEVAELSSKERRERKPPKQTVDEAVSRIGEGGYNILHNNCEHFAYECVFGKSTSSFIDDLRKNIRKKLNKD